MQTVDIYGRRYNIRGDKKPKTVQALAEHVDRRMRQVAREAAPDDAVTIAVLAAMNIAHDYYQARRALERREEELATRARELAESLGRALDTVDG